MATVGHAVVGMAAARLYGGRLPRWFIVALWSALAVIPDLDIIGISLGVPYVAAWGHRGATHSLAFAVAVSVAIGVLVGRRTGTPGRLTLCAIVALGSHGLIDTLTNAGLGCALLWPVVLTRYVAPWRPIPVAPIGWDLFTPYGAIVILVEVVFFSPLLLYAWRGAAVLARPVATTAFFAVWLTAVWLLTSTDPVRASIVAALLRDQTRYADEFSLEKFKAVREGQSPAAVRAVLGDPHGESWFYATDARTCRSIRFVKRQVVSAFRDDACTSAGIGPGTSQDEVERRLGAPGEFCWEYSWSPGFAYQARMVCFDKQKVDAIISGWAVSE